MMLRITGTLIALLFLAGCGGNDDGSKKIGISGRVHLDDLSRVQQIPEDGHASHGCVVASLAGKNVIITDPNGKKVGVVALGSMGTDDPMPSDSADKFYGGVPGTCNLTFKLSVTGESGVYTAEVEGIASTQTSFSDSDAGTVQLEVPDGS